MTVGLVAFILEVELVERYAAAGLIINQSIRKELVESDGQKLGTCSSHLGEP